MIKPDRIVTTTCPYCGVGCMLNLRVSFCHPLPSDSRELQALAATVLRSRFEEVMVRVSRYLGLKFPGLSSTEVDPDSTIDRM